MRYKDSITVGVYFVAGAVWLVWILDQQAVFGEPMSDIAALSVLGFVHPSARAPTARGLT